MAPSVWSCFNVLLLGFTLLLWLETGEVVGMGFGYRVKASLGIGMAMRLRASIQVGQWSVSGVLLYQLSFGNLRCFLQQNRDVAENVSTYKQTGTRH